MKFRLDRKTPFSRDAVFAWWTDFREDDHGHPGSPADSTRTILGRTGSEVWLRDRATRPMRVTIDEHVILNHPGADRERGLAAGPCDASDAGHDR